MSFLKHWKLDKSRTAAQFHARPCRQQCAIPGVPPASYLNLCSFFASILANILVIFLHKLAALQVSFTTKKEVQQMKFIKGPK